MFYRDDAYQEIYDRLYYLAYNPNNRDYDTTNLGTWSSLSDVEDFLSTYTRGNFYKTDTTELACGNRITINDGNYNTTWMIAGFDVESNRTASDDTVYDNGYGIALVPVTTVTSEKWNTASSYMATGGYISSYMHTSILPTVATKLQTVLGSHLISRNALLSSDISITSNKSTAYTWTTSYCTLMSVGQMNGIFDSYNNKYDDGEANYKLPVFKKNTTYSITDSAFWTRCIKSSQSAWIIKDNENVSSSNLFASYGVRPLIYIR